MADKYFCAHCDQEFVPESAEDSPRCPTCMRRAGVQGVGSTAPVSSTGRARSLLLFGLLLAAAAGYGLYRANTVALDEMPPVRPLEAKELAAYLERDGLEVGRLQGLFVIPDGADWPTDREALSKSMHERASSWPLDHALARDVYIADEALAAIAPGKDGPQRLYPLESAAAMTAILRGQGVDAMVAETWDLGEGRPPDPSGLLGYFVVAVYDDGAEEPTAYFDPWGGRGSVSPNEVRVLTDTQAIGAGLGTDAFRIVSKSGDGAAAFPLIETALTLDPKSPTLRSVHGTVLFDTGGVTPGNAEFEAAHQLRPDGPRELALAELSLAQASLLRMIGQGPSADSAIAAANRSLSSVVEEWPRYGKAHLLLAMLHFGNDEPDRVREELETAERLAPNTAALSALWAQYYVGKGEHGPARARAKQAVDLDPENWQLRVQVAKILSDAGDLPGAQEQVQTALSFVPAGKRAELEGYLSNSLGPQVLGRVAPNPSPGSLQLNDPSAPGRPVPEPAVQADPALILGNPSDMKLRDPDQNLRLELED